MRAVLAIALLASVSSCKKKTEDVAARAPTPSVKVQLVTAQNKPAPEVLMLTGLIAADQRSEVTADTQGKVVAVLVERGQRVKMGQPVVQLDVRTAALSAREAQANLATARAQKQLAEEECKRAQALLDKGAITRSEYDRQSTQCTSTLQQVSAAQARADMISKSIADGLVRAPFDGQVTEKSVAPGEWVAPGRKLFTLVDDDPLKIELSVPELVVSKVQQGQKVLLTAVAQPSKTFSATVTRIGGEIGRSRSLIVEATLDPQTDLVPGMFAEAHLVTGQAEHPVVPEDAVVKDGKLHYAFVAVDGELQKRLVQVGRAFEPGTHAILKGLASGDKLVVGLSKPDRKDAAASGQAGKAGGSGSGASASAPRIIARAGGQDVEIKDGLRYEEIGGAAPAPAEPKAAKPAEQAPAPAAPGSAGGADPQSGQTPKTGEK